jgi:hypothetical protein
MTSVLDRLTELGLGPIPRRTRRPGVVVAALTPLLRLSLASDLERAGFAVWAVGSGAAAVAACSDHRGEVDVLLAEADLPDLPSWALYASTRERFPDLSCYFLARRPEAAATARAMGAVVVAWPTPLGRLVDTLWAEALAHAGPGG